MINSINLFTMGNQNKSNRPKSSEEVQTIYNSLHTGQKKYEELSETEQATLNAFETLDNAVVKAEFFEEISKTEAIARKIAKGEAISQEEEQYISEKNPQLKKEAQKAKEEGEELARQLKSAKTKQQQQSLLSVAMGGVAALQDRVQPVVLQMKMDAILKASKEVGIEEDDALTGLRPGSLFDHKG